MGGSNKHITLTAEFCGKKCRGGNRLKLQAGGDRRETGGASYSSVHRLTRFCVLTHPRDRWEIKRRRKQNKQQILDRAVELLYLSLYRKSAIRGTFWSWRTNGKPWESLHRSSGSDTEKSLTMMQTCFKTLQQGLRVQRNVPLQSWSRRRERIKSSKSVCLWGSECVGAFLLGVCSCLMEERWMEVKRMMGCFL